MSNDSSEESIFLAALEAGDDSDRAAYLAGACGSDRELRRRVEGLLASYNAGDFLESPAIDLAVTALLAPTGEQPGTAIGPYTLLEQIGEGGFGVVFLAEQATPIRRRVALKIVKPGMDTRQVIARFEAERQALALMDHPNIAKVLDAGTTGEGASDEERGASEDSASAPAVAPHSSRLAPPTGRPYFVMELVQGVPITEYCDECHLPTRERLELFVAVCQAVQHAHQKGIIHRDLKPTNVLVALQDGRPVPKIIDFGVAKAIEQRLTDHTLTTAFAQMVGTPLYMSPEQAELSPLGVDTRTDIYSLGVLLYELLTGTTPFDKDRLHAACYDELRRIIREEVPPRPSMRLTTLAAGAATTIAEHRRTDARRLNQQVRGELDWIVMQCLEKDRNRRYDSVGSLARDVERYLHDEPVQAGPPSTSYRCRKFVQRNKAKLAACSAIAATLVIGLGLAAWQYVRATTENARAQAVSNLLQAILSPSDPDQTKRSKYNVRDLSDEFSGLGDQVAGYHVQLAEILTNQSRTALGPEDARLLSMAAAARTEKARQHIRQAIDAYEQMAIDYSDNRDRRLAAMDGFIQVLKVCLATPGFAVEVDELNGRLSAELPKFLAAFPQSTDCQWQTAMKYVEWAYALYRYPTYRSAEENAFKKEIELLEKIALSDPKRPLVWLFLADAYDYLGEINWELDRRDDAAAAFLRAQEIYDEHPTEIAADPTQTYGIASHYVRLAYFLAYSRREDEAAKMVRKAADVSKRNLDPVRTVTVLWAMAPVQLRMGNEVGYRETCQSLLDVPFGSLDDLTKVRAITTWCYGPDALDDLTLPVKLAEKFAANNSLGQPHVGPFCVGRALYRAGQHKLAIDQLAASIAAYPSEPVAGWDIIDLQRLYLAMTKWQLGHKDEARQLLEKTLPAVNKYLQSPLRGWNQLAELEILRREAVALIGTKAVGDAVENNSRTDGEPRAP